MPSRPISRSSPTTSPTSTRPASSGRAPNSPTCSTRRSGRRACPTAANQAIVPEGANIGLGVQTAAVRNLHIQGELTQTGNKLDLALIGRGWFQVEGAGRRHRSTPAPAPSTPMPIGQLVTRRRLHASSPASPFRTDATEVIVNRSGQVFARIDGQSDAAGSRPADDCQLRQRSRPEAARRQSVPADRGVRRTRSSASRTIRASATIQQGYLEIVQRRSGQGNHRPDLRPARL